ncbi:hypothetical protein LPJ64_004288 [Coemansia asiatica]|uniref:Armadillo repeat-containing protein 8 n=1 Tax=Coemansia asiatica TaxID=1052880 RepID=A0A9W7XI75_9FUNG|nr:hypothetical protein LPJ64_004288 [Coemansia asiatica]
MSTISVTHSNYVRLLGSSDPDEVYGALRTIKNNVIGSSTKKTLYIDLQIIPAVSALLTAHSTSVASRVQATAIVGSLARSRDSGAKAAAALASQGVVGALVGQLAENSDERLVEASERALNALLEHGETLSAAVAAATEGALVEQVLAIIDTADTETDLGIHSHARVELAVLIIGRLCVSEARQYMVANTGVIDALVRLLLAPKAHFRLQTATLRALAALSYENAEICAALGAVQGGSVAAAVLRLARATDATLRLHACEVAANLCRMRAVSSRDVQSVAVPALVRLVREADGVAAVQALGYLCHEDTDVQAVARSSGAIDALVARLKAAWSTEEGDFGDPVRGAREAKAAFLALGTVVSTNEECRRAAVDAGAFAHIVRALGHKDAGVRAAACLCARYIVRSVAICRTHAPESGILKPLLSLLHDSNSDVQATAAATLVNLLSDFSPLRVDALKQGLLPTLVQLLEAPAAPVRRNALWAVRNVLIKIDEDTRREVVEGVGIERLLSLSEPGADPAMHEHAVGALRNIVAESTWGIDRLFAARGVPRTLDLLAQLVSQSSAQSDRSVLVHSLYLVNNVAARSDARCCDIAGHQQLMKAVVSHTSSSVSEVAIAALWCINSIASHQREDDSRASLHAPALRRLGVARILSRLLRNQGLPLDVRDRVMSCQDYFPEIGRGSGEDDVEIDEEL